MRATTRDVAVLMNLSRPYDRQVLRGITAFVKEEGLHFQNIELARAVATCQTWVVAARRMT